MTERESLWTFLRRLLPWRRKWVVSATNPEETVGYRWTVKGWDEDDALRRATYILFSRQVPQWYSWTFEVIGRA